MTEKPPRKRKLKVISINRPGRYIYNTSHGSVRVYGENGESLTNERILWLLEVAKHEFLQEIVNGTSEDSKS